MKKVEELEYPDVVYITTEEEHQKLSKYKKFMSFRGIGWYLEKASGYSEKEYTGRPSKGKAYIHWRLSDIIFPEPNPKEISKIDEFNGYASGIDLVDNSLKFIKYNKVDEGTFYYDHILSPLEKTYHKLSAHKYTFKDVRPLNSDEIKWLEGCITCNKFIEREKAIQLTNIVKELDELLV